MKTLRQTLQQADHPARQQSANTQLGLKPAPKSTSLCGTWFECVPNKLEVSRLRSASSGKSFELARRRRCGDVKDAMPDDDASPRYRSRLLTTRKYSRRATSSKASARASGAETAIGYRRNTKANNRPESAKP